MQEMGVVFFVLIVLDLILKGAKFAWIVVIVWLSLKIKSTLSILLCIVNTSSGNWCGHQNGVAFQQSFLH
jgi:hypothetical protein